MLTNSDVDEGEFGCLELFRIVDHVRSQLALRSTPR
jgi:hypothetical protein